MDVSDDLVTIADIARLAEVKLPAVSNWRRRHEIFPRSELRNGRELLVAAEVAHWPVVLPPLVVQSIAAEVLDALDEKVVVYDEISRTTAALRDSLLSLLLAGPAVGTALLLIRSGVVDLRHNRDLTERSAVSAIEKHL